MQDDSSQRTLRGSCLCGGIRYEIVDHVGAMSHCHCSMCRKAHGAAFGTYARVAWERFRFVTGEDKLRRYRSSSDVTRTFCGECGSTLQFIPDGRPGFGLAVGTLDDDPCAKVTLQIWVRDKAPWWEPASDPPCFDTVPE
jgi:hypothetical protein